MHRGLTRFELFALVSSVFASAFSGYLASKVLIFNADALASTYMVMGRPFFHQMLWADWHTNLLKLPVVALQAALPFNEFTFVAMNVFLLLATAVGWAAATAYCFGRRYFAPTLLFVCTILIGSYWFSQEIGFTTIRNIEYPLYFWMMVYFWRHAEKQAGFWRSATIFAAVSTILYASDPFFSYITVPALLLVLCIRYASTGNTISRQVFCLAAGLSIAPVVFAKVLIKALEAIHVFSYYGQSLAPSTPTIDQLPSAFWAGIEDILRLYSGIFLGRPISFGLVSYVALFAVCVASIAAFIAATRKLREHSIESPGYASLLASAWIAFIIYVLTFSLSHQDRYISVLTLIFTTAAVVWSTPYWKQITSPAWLKYAAILCVFGFFATFCYHEYAVNYEQQYLVNKQNVKQLDARLEADGVNTIITGHSYASPMKFWSGGKFAIAPVLYCNQNLPFLTREQWYHALPSTQRVAIVVDRLGRDANSWQCGEQSLLNYYGTPAQTIETHGIDNTPIQVLIYPPQTLNKVHFITTKGTPTPLIN